MARGVSGWDSGSLDLKCRPRPSASSGSVVRDGADLLIVALYVDETDGCFLFYLNESGVPIIMNNTLLKLCVSVDIGCRQHSVAIGLPNRLMCWDEFDILHRPEGFKQFFERIDHHCRATRSKRLL